MQTDAYAKIFHEIRLHLGWSQAQLSYELGIRPRRISDIELGRWSLPEDPMLYRRLVEIPGVKVNDVKALISARGLPEEFLYQVDPPRLVKRKLPDFVHPLLEIRGIGEDDLPTLTRILESIVENYPA